MSSYDPDSPENWVGHRCNIEQYYRLAGTPEERQNRPKDKEGLERYWKEKVERWNAWSAADRSEEIHLQGAVLIEAQLQGVDLVWAHMHGVRLIRAQLQHADLIGAQMQGSYLNGAQLQCSYLNGAQLRCADMSGAHLQGSHLTGVRLQFANLIDAQMQGARLDQAWLEGANLDRAQLQGANLDGARLQHAILLCTQLQGSTLRGAQLQSTLFFEANLQGAFLIGAQLQSACLGRVQLQGANLTEAMMQGANLTKALLQGACLDRAQLQGANLTEALLQGARLDRAQLQGAQLGRAQLREAHLTEAQMQRVDLVEADLRQALLFRAQLNGAILWGAQFQDAQLQGVQLQGAELISAQLQGAVLYKAQLQGAQLQGVNLSFVIVDGLTLISSCAIDSETDFTGVGLASARVEPGIVPLLEYNIRRRRWREWYEKHPVQALFVWPLWSISNYGRSTLRILLWFFGLAFAFAGVYWAFEPRFPLVANLSNPPGTAETISGGLQFVRSLYFSVVTMTTLGFGDIHANPTSWGGHILLTLQVLLGYVMLAALVTRLAVLFTTGGPERTDLYTEPPRFADAKLIWCIWKPRLRRKIGNRRLIRLSRFWSRARRWVRHRLKG